MDPVSNLADVDGVVVSLAVGGVVSVVWILRCEMLLYKFPTVSYLSDLPGLRNCSVIPNVAVMREAVGHKSSGILDVYNIF